MNSLPLKYSDSKGKGYCEALIPSECCRGADVNGLFRCTTGDIVRVKWCGSFNNEKGMSDGDLEEISRRLYKWTFARVRSEWIARLDKVEDRWDWIKMYKVENDGRN